MPTEPVITFVQAVLLGLIQGITEFLPVSSTAHMRIASQLLYGTDAGATFSAIAQLGPIVAIVAYFRKDLGRYMAGILRTKSPKNVAKDDLDARLGWFTLLGTLPLILFGVLLDHKIHTTFRSLYYIAFSLVALALVLIWAERVGKKNVGLKDMTLRQSQLIGWAQVLALVPGASRSGVTITAGLFAGLNRESAARFSFLLSIPAITAAGLYELAKAMTHAKGLGSNIVSYFAAAIVAGIVAYAVVNWFLRFMKEHTTSGFIIYRIVLGVLLLVLLQAQVLKPDTTTESTPAKVTKQLGHRHNSVASAPNSLYHKI